MTRNCWKSPTKKDGLEMPYHRGIFGFSDFWLECYESCWKYKNIGYIPKIHDAHRAIVENPQEKRQVRSTIGEFLASDESMLNGWHNLWYGPNHVQVNCD